MLKKVKKAQEGRASAADSARQGAGTGQARRRHGNSEAAQAWGVLTPVPAAAVCWHAQLTVWNFLPHAHSHKCCPQPSSTTAKELQPCVSCAAARTRQLLTVRQLSHHRRLLLLPHRRQREARCHAVQTDAFPLAFGLRSSFLQAGRQAGRRTGNVGQVQFGEVNTGIPAELKALAPATPVTMPLPLNFNPPKTPKPSAPALPPSAHTPLPVMHSQKCKQVTAPARRCAAS